MVHDEMAEVEWQMNLIARTIYDQLGGRGFCAMVGATDLTYSSDSFSFKIPTGLAKDRINHVRVSLTPEDLYDMEFTSIRGRNVRTVYKASGVSCDKLAEVFTDHTGLFTGLR